MLKNHAEKIFFYETSLTPIAISEGGDKAITHVEFALRGENPRGFEVEETPLIAEAHRQLEMYLSGKLREFSLLLRPSGTEFQKKVWDALLKIPFGKTATYKEIAISVGNPNACRAVGGANNKNPISIFIPCHRVIGANGQLVGYGGGLAVKEKLLRIEGCYTI